MYGGVSGHGVTSSVRDGGLCAWWGLGERGADLCVDDVNLRVRGVRLCVRGGVQVSVVRVYVGVVCCG